MHFRKASPYLCEAFHIMASSPLPKPNTFTWGAHLYEKLHRRLIAGRQRPFTVLPWCFADPRNCDEDIQFPDPFLPDPESWGGRRWDGRGEVGKSGRELLEEKVGWVWTVHLHNQWRKDFPVGGWMERLLEGLKGQLEEIERYVRVVRSGGGGGVGGAGEKVSDGGLQGEKVMVKRRLLEVGEEVSEQADELQEVVKMEEGDPGEEIVVQ